MKIGHKLIGEGQPCFIIAEIGMNHNGSMKNARKLIDMSVEAGADCVKFQMRDLHALYKKDAIDNTIGEDLSVQYTISLLRKFQLSTEQMKELENYAAQKNVLFLCTPWDKPSVNELERIGVPAYKLASADMTNEDLLDCIIDTGKPIIVSTGMSTVGEIEKTVMFLKRRNADFALLHCNSTYPAPSKDINLRFMIELKKYGVPVGYSGHERGIAISEAAVALGACIIERHVTLDRTMEGPDHAASLEFPGLQKLVRDIRNIELAMGSNHRWLTQGERLNRENLAKSLVAAVDIAIGQVITRDMISVKSPGKGISPQRFEELIGKRAIRDIRHDDYFSEDDLNENVKEFYAYEFKRKWGLVVRYHDIDTILRKSTPDLLEFHLSYDDVDHEFKIKDYRQNLIVHAPELFRGDDLLDLCATDEAKRRASIENLQKVIAVTHKIRKHFTVERKTYIVTHVGGFSMDEPIHVRTALYDNLERSLRDLAEGDTEVIIENMPPFPWLFGGQRYHNVFVSPSEIADFCKRTGRRICFDTSHAILACNHLRVPMAEYTRTVMPYIAHIHIADGAGIDGEGLQIDEGEIDFKELGALLDGCNASFVPEVWQGHKFGGDGFWVSLDKLSKYSF
jgi:sialic acid synthase SpsE/sugar phosphate isomerase/epimerase